MSRLMYAGLAVALALAVVDAVVLLAHLVGIV